MGIYNKSQLHADLLTICSKRGERFVLANGKMIMVYTNELFRITNISQRCMIILKNNIIVDLDNLDTGTLVGYSVLSTIIAIEDAYV